ncbi:hypothetical protein D9757_015507 [Collybiopsis confluens]|uniref:Uncharacterized protein n=1 Tax=Collybiopsis confluens TaxID=2823264 RepID=A0A8H5C4X1_9AGAR|nr:hypothetical protein D9757_015507 [Collybiopsis confluens]
MLSTARRTVSRPIELADIRLESPPITRSIPLDVLCLSTALDKRTAADPSRSHAQGTWRSESQGASSEVTGEGRDRTGNRAFLHNLAAICTIGTDDDPQANKVMAVTGTVNVRSTLIEELTFATNERISTGGPSTTASVPQTTRIVPQVSQGKVLITKWSSSSLFVDVNAHVRDVVSILVYFRSVQDDQIWLAQLPSFRTFITLRSRFKLQSRLKLFQEQWGHHPFKFLQVVRNLHFEAAEIVLEAPVADTTFYKTYPRLFKLSNRQRIATINASNITDWGSIFQDLWSSLQAGLIEVFKAVPRSQTGFPPSRGRVPSRIPQPSTAHPSTTFTIKNRVTTLVNVLGLLRLLQPILHHILLLEIYENPIEQALIAQARRHITNHSPSPLGQFYARFNTITGWYAAANEVAEHFRNAVDPRVTFHMLAGHAGPPQAITMVDTERIRELIPSSVNLPPRQQFFDRVRTASVHAEAALMCHVLQRVDSSEYEFIFGVGRKCCAMCWFFHEECVDLVPDTSLNTRSTHETFYPWPPPHGTPEYTVHRLRMHLIDVLLGRTVRSTSQLSSGPEMPPHLHSSSLLA